MKCVICKNGDTHEGTAIVTLVRGEMTLVLKRVPAQVCENCGEEYVADDTARRLFNVADDAQRAGVQVDVRDFVAA